VGTGADFNLVEPLKELRGDDEAEGKAEQETYGGRVAYGSRSQDLQMGRTVANDSTRNFDTPHQSAISNSLLHFSSGGQPLSHGHPEGPFLTQGATISSSKASPSPPTLVISEPKNPDETPDENAKTKTGLKIDAAVNNELGQDETASSEVQTDLSFMQALDCRDVAEIDRRVELHERTKPDVSLNFDDPDGMPEQDESCDDEPCVEEDGEAMPEAKAQSPTDTAGEVAARVKRILDAKTEHGLPKLRRRGATKPPQEMN